MFWSAHEAELEFCRELEGRLSSIMPDDCILRRRGALVAAATDATDLRMELPLLVVEPDTPEQISALVRLANEMKFAIIPRGGASGLTGGAVPARKRTVMVSTTRLTAKSVNKAARTMTCQAGVITQDAIDFAASKGLLFTVDPASKTASTIGGNVSENSGGPFCFEYGTTIDNLLSWSMVTPTGEIIRIERVNHPGHKIMPDEEVVFEVKDLSGGMRNVVRLRGNEVRHAGLGKDVTNKLLNGLPGMQKEGIDGIITEATFVLHPKPSLSRVMVLEFYGKSMRSRGRARAQDRESARQDPRTGRRRACVRAGGIQFQVRAGHQLSAQVRPAQGQPHLRHHRAGGRQRRLCARRHRAGHLRPCRRRSPRVRRHRQRRQAGRRILGGRHRLSAIAKRTSGFKMNEDVVLPMAQIPEFAHYLETLNVVAAADAYRFALQELSRLPGLPAGRSGLQRRVRLRLPRGRER